MTERNPLSEYRAYVIFYEKVTVTIGFTAERT
jgi:hypothetical protein